MQLKNNKSINIIAAILLLLMLTNLAIAKKVQFNVDMRYQTLDSFGVHVSGDFLTALGFSANWLSDSVQLTQVGTSTVYSKVVDLPAFKTYEYYYLNGKETYQVEFVPYESQVIFNFGTNRWIYIDSLANDTTVLPALVFSTNAPDGKALIRHRVDMQNTSPDNVLGVHVATDADNFNYTNKRMYSFDGKIYEYLTYQDSSAAITQKYIYANGNTVAKAETVPTACASSGKRNTINNTHVILPIVCFSACTACIPTNTNDIPDNNFIQIKNTIADADLQIENKINATIIYSIINMQGQVLKRFTNNFALQNVDVKNYATGNYILVANNGLQIKSMRWVKK